MDLPTDYRLLESHEWHQKNADGTITVGITQFAADELTDVTFVALPKIGTKLTANGRFGEVESVKATSDLYCGVAGEVVAVNDALTADPGLVNRESYTGGWIMKVKPSNPGDFEALLSAADYLKKTNH
jgi:glycine cleavage system H protein